MIFCVVAGLILSMNTATMDGSRALYGISRDGMTIREFGVLNKHHVPGRAMTLDALLNIFLISAFAGVLEILAVSNVGYVFATCAALSGFLLLRKDRPDWPRPVRLPNYWVPLAAVLFLINLTFLIVGGFLYSGGFLGIEGYGYGWDKTRTGLLVLLAALVLYVWRHVVQDKHADQAARADSAHARGGAGARRAEDRAHGGVGAAAAQLPAAATPPAAPSAAGPRWPAGSACGGTGG